MNYKTTNRLLKKGSRRAVFYQVLCAAVILAVLAPASYLYGVMTAGEGVNFSLYERVFSETVRPAGDGTMPESEVAEALLALGSGPIERSTYNGLVIWSTVVPQPRGSWEHQLAREWAHQRISVQTGEGMVQGGLRLGREKMALLAKATDPPGFVEIFAFEQGSDDRRADAFRAAGLPTPPRDAEIFDYSGSTDSGVALAFRARDSLVLVREYADMMEAEGWRPVPVPPDRDGAMILERDGKRVTVRGLESGNHTYVTLVVF